MLSYFLTKLSVVTWPCSIGNRHFRLVGALDAFLDL